MGKRTVAVILLSHRESGAWCAYVEDNPRQERFANSPLQAVGKSLAHLCDLAKAPQYPTWESFISTLGYLALTGRRTELGVLVGANTEVTVFMPGVAYEEWVQNEDPALLHPCYPSRQAQPSATRRSRIFRNPMQPVSPEIIRSLIHRRPCTP